MVTLAVIGYPDEHTAEEVRLKLIKLQKEYLLDLRDAVVVVRDEQGKIRLRQMHSMTATGAIVGGFWGTLVGFIFLNPLFGMAVGATWGAISGALADAGIDDAFMKQLADTLKPGTAALCVLLHSPAPDKVVEEIRQFGGTVIKTNLSHEDEARLQKALAPTKAPA